MSRNRSHYEEVFDAVRHDDADRALELIDADESLLNAIDANQNTPLLVALRHKRLELARQLIERRANVFVVNHSDRWAMRLIVERSVLKRDDRERLVETAIAAGVWDADIFHAVWRRDHAHAKAILSRDPQQALTRLADPAGADGFYNTLPYCGLSPLHYAVLAGDQRMVRLLLEFYCSLDMFKLLVEQGADVRDGDDAPLYGAVWQHAYRHWDYESVIRYLVGKGSRPRGLYHCALAGNLSAAKLLLELGANVNETRDDGWPGLNAGHTPLDYCTGVAGERQYPQLAEFLRQHGSRHSSELASDGSNS